MSGFFCDLAFRLVTLKSSVLIFVVIFSSFILVASFLNYSLFHTWLILKLLDQGKHKVDKLKNILLKSKNNLKNKVWFRIFYKTLIRLKQVETQFNWVDVLRGAIFKEKWASLRNAFA